VDFLNKYHIIDIAVLAWYVIFGIFFLWMALTAVPTTAAALNTQAYVSIMQGYVQFLVTIILAFAAVYAVLIYFARKAGHDHKHIWPWLKKIYPSTSHVGSSVMAFMLLLCILIVSVYLRTTMLQFFGFYEPDGFYYFSVVRAAVNNGLQVPSALSISGWPSHAPYTEAKGLIYITLIPYAILQYFGVSYYTIMRLSSVAFAILDMLGAYLLSRYLSRDKLLGLLVIAFVGFSMGNAARTSALIYRGDTFVTFFLIAALVLFVEIFRQGDSNRKIIFAALAGAVLAMSNLVWNGAPFADATFILAFIILVLSAFILRKETLVSDSKYLLISLLLWYIIVISAHLMGFIAGQQFVDPSFIPVYISLAAFWALAYYLTSNIQDITFMQSTASRLMLIVSVLVIGVVAFSLIESSLVYAIFIGNGFISAPGSFGTTIQELQPPTADFLYTSFGINLFTTPQTLAMYLPAYFGFQSPIWVYDIGIIGVILLFALSVPYLYMQIYDSGGFASGNARVRLDLNIAMVAIIAYFVLTAYLQMHAIRFNSLVSIPLAMLSAYTIYWIVTKALNLAKGDSAKLIVGGICLLFFALFFYYLLINDNAYAQTLSQADSINPTFLSALTWMKANVPSNSVVLTLWPDGSVVEGVANLTSVTDSVGSQNGTKMTPFAAWILNSSSDPQFLSSRITGRPNYLLVRFPWLIETHGIYTEAEIASNASLFGYLPLTQFEEGSLNATTTQLIFRNSPTGYPYAVIDLKRISNTSAQSTIYGYVQISQAQVSPFGEVGFYYQQSGNFTLAPQSQLNGSNGESLIITVSDVPRTGFPLNITGAYIFAPGLAYSNMIKFLYFCSSSACIWDNNQSTMRLVYQNADTKIFRITYSS